MFEPSSKGSTDLLVAYVLNKKTTTSRPVLQRTTNILHAAKDTMPGFLLCASFADGRGIVDLIDQPGNVPPSFDLLSTRTDTGAAGSILVKLRFAPAHEFRYWPLKLQGTSRRRPIHWTSMMDKSIVDLCTEKVLRPSALVLIQYESGLSSDSESVDDVDGSKNESKSDDEGTTALLDLYLPRSLDSISSVHLPFNPEYLDHLGLGVVNGTYVEV
ncbi:hypothetical protein GALMADRAFT_143357 [Galerina marginata CBS 339.88]|uniref:Uncharacterized protein n=1 Tax=Galerina marginata (strain CBS 339.88) TaxID=685588 RepID=A0A067SM96_GALM3|nr:hypothetical protein GALMADRAFT_143357 [Galerina marginata CBS 339.88]